MLKGREGGPQGLEDQGVEDRRRPTGEGTVGGQEQWDLWHCGAGRKIRPVRKPEKGESKGQDILCAQGCSGRDGGWGVRRWGGEVGWLERTLADEDGIWGWLCCLGEGSGEYGDCLGAGRWSPLLEGFSGKHSGGSEALVPFACLKKPGAS